MMIHEVSTATMEGDGGEGEEGRCGVEEKGRMWNTVGEKERDEAFLFFN